MQFNGRNPIDRTETVVYNTVMEGNGVFADRICGGVFHFNHIFMQKGKGVFFRKIRRGVFAFL